MGALAAAILLAGGASAQTVFTAAVGPRCKNESQPGFGLWTCPGPAGYAVQFSDEGNMVALTIAPWRAIKKAGTTAQWRGSGKAFGEKVHWIMRGGIPRAAVIRTWRRADDDSEVLELSVFAIEGAKACAYGTVDIHMANANEAALANADEAAGAGCRKN